MTHEHSVDDDGSPSLRTELRALDPDTDPLAPGRFERAVASRILEVDMRPFVPMDPLYGLWSLSRPLLVAASIVALVLIGDSVRQRPRPQAAPATIAESMGVPPQLLSTGPRQ